MKKEVIWILNHYSFPDGYGYHTRQHFIAKCLVKLGYDVIIFTSSFNHLKTKDIDLNNQKYLVEKIDEIDYVWIETREYAGNGLGRILNLLDYSLNFEKIYSNIDKKPDILWVSSPQPFVIYNGVKLKKKFKAKFIFEERDIWPLTLIQINKISKFNPIMLLFRFLQLKAYAYADTIISPLSNLKEFVSLSGFPSKKVELLVQPFSEIIPETYDLNLPKNKFIVGYIGSIGESNSVFNLIKSAILFKEYEDVFFLIVGNGPQLTEIKKFAEDNKVRNILFTGNLKKSFSIDLMNRCSVLYSGNPNIDLYRYGTASVKILDYMWMNKPIINSTNTLNDIVESSNAGVIIEPNNEYLLFDTILKLKEDGIFYNSFMNKGREYINNNCTEKVILERIKNIMGNI